MTSNVRRNARPLFSKRCGCDNHDIFTDNGEISFNMRSRSFFFSRKEYTELLRRNLVKKTTTSICTVCLAYARKKLEERDNAQPNRNVLQPGPSVSETDISLLGTDNTITIEHDESMEADAEQLADNENTMNSESDDNDHNDNNASLIDSIENLTQQIRGLRWSDIDDGNLKQSLCGLAESLGLLIRMDLDHEKEDMAEKCKSFDNLLSINYTEWYQQRNHLLKSFIFGCTGVDEKHENKKKFNAAIHTIEQIHYTKNINMVTPFSFMRNILSYTISRSKMSCNIIGASEGSGSYTKVNSLLNKESDPLTIQDESNIIITFDNEQKVGRHSGRIREKSKQPLSIITTVGVIESNPKIRTQFEEVQREDLNITEALARVNFLEKMYRDTMNNYRLQFISEMISAVVKEHFSGQRKHSNDYVDTALHFEKMFVCPVCRHVDDESFEICPQPSCGFNTSFYEHGYDRYYRTPAQHIGTPEIHYAEPVLVNPASFQNVKLVLESIESEVFGEEKERKWVVVMCDGVPYEFASIMQDSYKVCGICSKHVNIDMLTEHSKYHNEIDIEVIEYTMPFERTFLRPGPGHIELNIGRKLLWFLWEPFMKQFAIGLGFRTPNALKVFKNGIDHHRTCQVLETCLFALAKELLVPYVRRCLISKSVPTAEGYFSWYGECVTSQKYGFLFHVTFWYLLSFVVFKEGVRKNNSDIMMAGRTVFAPLFYCGHHPKYTRLLLRDLVERVKYPDIVSTFAKSTESHSVSGKSFGGQGGDFIHEEINKEIKSYLQGIGIPTKNTWVNIIRKAKPLQAMKDILFENSDLNTESGKKRPKRFEHEILMVRKMLRKEHFLEQYDEEETLTTFSGDPLDKSLCDFSYVARKNYEDYKEELSTNGTYGTKKMPPIFITTEERSEFEKIENKTIKEIKAELRNISSKMREKDAAFLLNQKLDRKTNLKKHEYVEMYYESIKFLELQEAEKTSTELHNDKNDNFEEEDEL